MTRNTPAPENLLCFGDNLGFLTDLALLPDGSVDLIYLDPPFNSRQPYSVLFREANGKPGRASVRAFDDVWPWDEAAARQLEGLLAGPRSAPGPLAALLRTFEQFLGHSEMLAYLVHMAARLVVLHRVLNDTGSLYLHCDPTASHYLKIVLDAIFGPRNLRREIVWRSGWVSGFKAAARNWARNHDILLYYVKSGTGFTFHKLFEPHPQGYGRRGGGHNPRGVARDDVWTDIYSPWIMSFSKEKLGYATQKPVALLERILRASSNPGDVVLDPFCGCGTTLEAVEVLNRENPDEAPRRWIGIDSTQLAIRLTRYRLERLDPPAGYRVLGEPADAAAAAELAGRDPTQFRLWALGLVDARPRADERQRAAGRIDGEIHFRQDSHGGIGRALVRVESGRVRADDVRRLEQALDREGAAIGVLIALLPPGPRARQAASAAGVCSCEGHRAEYPRIQVRTIEELLAVGPESWTARLAMPPRAPWEAFGAARSSSGSTRRSGARAGAERRVLL